MPISQDKSRLQIIISNELKIAIQKYCHTFGLSESALCSVLLSEKICELILQEEAENETQKKDTLFKA